MRHFRVSADLFDLARFMHYNGEDVLRLGGRYRNGYNSNIHNDRSTES